MYTGRLREQAGGEGGSPGVRQTKKEKLDALRGEILRLQGLGRQPGLGRPHIPLGPVLHNMPGRMFPAGAVHEFLSPGPAAAAATRGFISAMTGTLMQSGKPCLWVSIGRTVFPPGLEAFGVDPGRIIFIDAAGDKDALWIMEEALKCEALCVVIGEIKALDFTGSRRLQLAVENSGVTGFIHRLCPRGIRPVACVARWQVSPLESRTKDGLPGIGFPRWKVELLKIRNGRPGCWQLEWRDHAFHAADEPGRERISPVVKTIVA